MYLLIHTLDTCFWCWSPHVINWCQCIQYIPWNMHTICSVIVGPGNYVIIPCRFMLYIYSLLFSTDHNPIWWKVHSQCNSNFSFSGFVCPETSLPMGLNSMDVAGACLLNAVLTKNFIRKQASLQSSHTTRSQQTRYHTFQTVPPLGSPLLRLSYSTCPAAWTISYTTY